MQNRDGVVIRGEHVPHSVAARDWYCECGQKVVTRWFEIGPHWRSVCSADGDHPPDNFVHTKAIEFVQWKNVQERLEAEDVLSQLPPELQAAIMKGE